jgi:hypothetical protein
MNDLSFVALFSIDETLTRLQLFIFLNLFTKKICRSLDLAMEGFVLIDADRVQVFWTRTR